MLQGRLRLPRTRPTRSSCRSSGDDIAFGPQEPGAGRAALEAAVGRSSTASALRRSPAGVRRTVGRAASCSWRRLPPSWSREPELVIFDEPHRTSWTWKNRAWVKAAIEGLTQQGRHQPAYPDPGRRFWRALVFHQGRSLRRRVGQAIARYREIAASWEKPACRRPQPDAPDEAPREDRRVGTDCRAGSS